MRAHVASSTSPAIDDADDGMPATVPAGSALEAVKGLAGGDVQAEVRPSGAGYWVPVEWTWDGLTDAAFAETGTVTVPGVATGPSGERLDATLTVIVSAG
jgi:hypothetical protein